MSPCRVACITLCDCIWHVSSHSGDCWLQLAIAIVGLRFRVLHQHRYNVVRRQLTFSTFTVMSLCLVCNLEYSIRDGQLVSY